MMLRETPRPECANADASGGPRQGETGPTVPTIDRRNEDAAFIRALVALRRRRIDRLAIPKMSEPAWDILLDVYACQLEGIRLPITAVGIMAAIPAATAQRWIKRLTQQGMLVRIADTGDQRRAYVSLAAGTWEAMRAWHADAREQLSKW
jgi:DNA-binding MarR family transcriptional regulator